MISRYSNIKVLGNSRNYSKVISVLKDYVNSSNTNKYKEEKREDIVVQALRNVPVKEPSDWGKVRQFIFEHKDNRNQKYNNANIDGTIMGCCASQFKDIGLAQTYLKYLKTQNKHPNLATIGAYLKLLYQINQEKISKKCEQEILVTCAELRGNNPILDSFTLEHMIAALSLTKNWKECVNLLQEVKITSIPTSQCYSAVISSAFLNKEENLAWDLLKEMIELEKEPQSNVYLSYLKSLLKTKESMVQKLEKLFLFFKEYEIVCTDDVAKAIVNTCGAFCFETTVKFSGLCQNCNSQLQKFELTQEEFSELQKVFFQKVIVGKDIFIKSNPSEVDNFKQFVSKMGQHDVVLDGLNIAYSAGANKGPFVFSRMVASVISHFVQQNKKVLMLGRAHMTRWPKQNWNYITQNASVFLTQNISQDDPYLLYCALHSGKDTIIVTRDLMRGHKFLLKERKYKVLFNRWLSQRQYYLKYVNENKQVFFRTPPSFAAVAQKEELKWHIPYKSDTLANEAFHRSWLCVDLNKFK